MRAVFERFTPGARQLLVRAQEQAIGMGHCWIGCEHLLLAVADTRTREGGLLREKGASPQAVEEAISAVIGMEACDGGDKILLAGLGIDADAVRMAVEVTFGEGALRAAPTTVRHRRRRRLGRLRARCTPSPGPPFTPRAKRCLELSLREALRLKHTHIGVEHITLALLARTDTVAWQVLLHVGVRPDDLRQALEEALGPPA